MIERKNCGLSKSINQTMKNKMKFADDTTLTADGIDDVLITKRESGHSLIRYVLFIPEIKCNFLSINFSEWQECKNKIKKTKYPLTNHHYFLYNHKSYYLKVKKSNKFARVSKIWQKWPLLRQVLQSSSIF